MDFYLSEQGGHRPGSRLAMGRGTPLPEQETQLRGNPNKRQPYSLPPSHTDRNPPYRILKTEITTSTTTEPKEVSRSCIYGSGGNESMGSSFLLGLFRLLSRFCSRPFFLLGVLLLVICLPSLPLVLIPDSG